MPSSIEPPTRRILLNPKLGRIKATRPEVVEIKQRPKGTMANATFAARPVTRALIVCKIQTMILMNKCRSNHSVENLTFFEIIKFSHNVIQGAEV